MRKIFTLLIVAIPLSFFLGIFASDFTRATARMFLPETTPRCIDTKVCVGAEAPKVFGFLNADRHGLTGLFCNEAPEADRDIFLDGIIRGDRCPSQRFTIELRSPTTRTLLEVDKGRLVKITEGASHIIDF